MNNAEGADDDEDELDEGVNVEGVNITAVNLAWLSSPFWGQCRWIVLDWELEK